MKYLFILLSLFIVGCSQHLHKHSYYMYKIKYGKDINNLNKELISTCEAYSHPKQYEKTCLDKVNKIDNYICALDNRLYLLNTVYYGSNKKQYVYSSIQKLDNIYCKIEPTIITYKTLDLIENNTFSPDIEKVISNNL